MEEPKRKNPWLGLESYQEGEILYGRDEDIRDLTQCVLSDMATLLYGKSGIGKSSILNAGIIPALRRYGYQPVLIRLSHKEPHTYLSQIKDAIANTIHIKQEIECKDVDKETLYEFFHRHTFYANDGERTKLFIIFDQFEEIFTLQSDEATKKHFFAELADFLNDIMPSNLQIEVVPKADKQEVIKMLDEGSFDDIFNNQELGVEPEIPEYVTDNVIHLVLTIREDFLSEFEYYTASIPSLKQNRYGLRAISEEQAAQIILRPIPGLISNQVAKLIIEKVTGRFDFELNGVSEIEVDSAVLSLYLNRLYDAKTENKITSKLVEDKGGEIIADFYDDAISGISESSIGYLEDMLLNGQGRRDNITIYDAKNDGGVTEEELNILCNNKKILRQFNYSGDLRIEFVHDILCPIVKTHKDERSLLKQQEAERLKQEREKQELVRKQREELRRIEIENKRQRRKNGIRLAAVLSLLLVGGISWAAWYLLYRYPFKSCYASFTIKNGWPEGIGQELDENDKTKMPVHYQLIRYGYKNKNTRVNILNSHNSPARNVFYGSPLVGLFETEGNDENAKSFATLQRNTSYWIFTPDNEGIILRKTAYDLAGNQLYSVQFFRSTTSTENTGVQLWANYVDTNGKSMRVRDNGADRIRIIFNPNGYYIGQQFFSEMGTPQSNVSGAYGYRYQLGEDGRVLQRLSVDAFGDSIHGQTITYSTFDKYGRWVKAMLGKAEYDNNKVIVTMAADTDSLLFDDDGELKYYATENHDSSYYNRYWYDDNNTVNTALFHKTNHGLKLKYQRLLLPKDKNVYQIQEYWADSIQPYRLRREVVDDKKRIIRYYCGTSPSSINEPYMITTTEGTYHQLKTDTVQDGDYLKVTNEYFDDSGNLSNLCEVNRDIAYYNADHEMRKHYGYKNGEICWAYLNDYENGQIVAQSVIDEEANVIRYPKWDKWNLCYFKMKFVRVSSTKLIAIKGVNEFGEESLITLDKDGIQDYNIIPLPAVEMTNYEDNTLISGLQIYKESLHHINTYNHVEYILITNKKGSWYKAGIRSGDLLVKEDKQITVARPNIIKNSYDVLTFSPNMGDDGAEHYPVYFTQKEMDRYNNAINHRR